MMRSVICMTRFVVTLVLVAAMAVPAQACPFCSAPSLTLSEQVNQADVAVLGAWVGGTEAKGTDVGKTDFEIVEIASNKANGKFAAKEKLSVLNYRKGKPGDLYLLLATKGDSGLDWGSPIEVTRETYKYLKEAPAPDAPATTRLAYFMSRLEDPIHVISDDAYAEFANTDYDKLVPLAAKMPRDKLRAWLSDPKVAPSRLGLYGLMLGLCGEAADAELMEKKIFTATGDEFRLGIDGVMGGYLLLTKEAGLAKLEQQKLSASAKAPFSEVYAAMQAIRFMWQYGDGQIAAPRLRQAMRVLLERPELADLVIADLARWKDWEIQDRLMKLYDEDEYGIPSIKRAIVRFMLASTKDAPPRSEGRRRPQTDSRTRHPSPEVPATTGRKRPENRRTGEAVLVAEVELGIEMSRDPAELNRAFSASVQTQAEQKLGRALTADEEYRIWNLGSFMLLEVVSMEIFYSESPDEVEKCLAGLPKRDPLPEEYTRRPFNE